MQSRIMTAVCLLVIVVATGAAETYRVGPGEKYARISDVAEKLQAGDVVEVTGDITDSFTLTANGLPTDPVVIRGAVRIDGGRIVRPRIVFDEDERVIALCQGDCTVIEGLEFTGSPRSDRRFVRAISHNCDYLTIRNCAFRNLNGRAVGGWPTAGSITIEFCEFDSVGNLPMNGHAVNLMSWKPGAVVTVEHCWFHDCTGGMFFYSYSFRNVIRYNWFENAHVGCLGIFGRLEGYSRDSDSTTFEPMHSDVVGNVFFQGWSPGLLYSTLRLGGDQARNPGMEGDFNIAHNLFITTRNSAASGEEKETVHLKVLGNVDNIRLYNNIFLEYGVDGAAVYSRGRTWDTPRTKAFVERRGSGEPIVAGSNNWISQKAFAPGIPAALKETIRGLNPLFVDLINFDFRPAKDSPLVGAGLSPLPQGRIVDLLPEYEPQRGIPVDLKPKVRRKVTPPSIGPFEALE